MLVGQALVLGDNVNTDVLHPSQFYSLNDNNVRNGFLRAVEGHEETADTDVSGCLVIAGANFGCGSSRETGARVFLLAGIQAVVAVSFARIFHRNVLNLGLPAFTCPELADIKPAVGESVTLNPQTHTLQFGDNTLKLDALDPHWKRVLDAGGLAPMLGIE